MRRLPQTVDGVSEELDIAKLWREKYSNMFNNVYGRAEKTVSLALDGVPSDRIDFTSMEEICLCA